MGGTMDSLNLHGWRPIRIYRDDTGPMVDWAWVQDAPHLAPFYKQSVEEQLHRPFHHAFRRQTSLAEMLAWHEASPGLEPSLVVFHVSRCGSTLVSQMLSRSPHHLALSEAPPLDVLLREAIDHRWLTSEQAIAAARAWVSAWAQRSHPESPSLQSVSIKLDAWNNGKAPLVAAAWPDASLVFVVRDPLPVLVSQMRERAYFMVPGSLGIGLDGIDLPQLLAIPPDEYCARMLGYCYGEMVRTLEQVHPVIIDHSELPSAVEQTILPLMGWKPKEAELAAMRERAAHHGKQPHQPYAPDDVAKRSAADDRLRNLSACWIEEHYQTLLRWRKAHAHTRSKWEETVV